MRVKVNDPHVVHETIEGETILLDLRTGMYYSLDETGSALWDFLATTGDPGMAVEVLAGEAEMPESYFREGVDAFVNKLVVEGLLLVVESLESATEPPENLIATLRARAKPFEHPIMEKYADMQDLLLLDPIHDVDEAGWPEPKEDE